MPSFKDPAFEQQQKDLAAQIDALEKQIEAASEDADTSGLEQQVEQLEGQLSAVKKKYKAARDVKREEWKARKGEDKP